ncbi:MAG: transporter substrate-binding domain-containing protein [Rhodobacter sp.]|nr:transporter substrate-binding domain-containing protein [Rhodobacter sp.]
MRHLTFMMLALLGLLTLQPVQAQDQPLVFNTIERPPFSMQENGQASGFSIDLMRAIAGTLHRDIQFTYVDNFTQMLGSVEAGTVDGAIANISITAARESVLDFSQPIFEGGLQIMVSGDAGSGGIWRAIFSLDLLMAILAAFAVLFVLGLLMWLFERRKQPYFDRPFDEALFPSFWWALNLVVNGGFEERLPKSPMGRLLGVLMVISSLFIVSIFVANITASLTVDAITGSIQSLDDLEGRRVATTTGSTAADFLAARDIAFRDFGSFAELLNAFEEGGLDAVVFDGPILAFYVANKSIGDARLIDRIFRPENYGIALPQGSPLREPINRALLELNESGGYRDLADKWFGRRN